MRFQFLRTRLNASQKNWVTQESTPQELKSTAKLSNIPLTKFIDGIDEAW